MLKGELDEVVWFYGQDTDFVRALRRGENSNGCAATSFHGLRVRCVKGLPTSFDVYINAAKRQLFIVDDLMQSAGESSALTDLFCNKLQHVGLSVMLLLQNLFYRGRERVTLVRCAQYLVIFKNPMDKSIPLHLAQKLMPLRKAAFMDMFERATEKPHGYLFCDGKQDTPDYARFRTDLFDNGVQKVFVPRKYEGDAKKKGSGRG